ncbi:MAG: metal-sulfur cluster biosynthetic enzyme [Bacillariaceae sp.]|jgi:metal-sulfur cluster biosynthetic enzyme
MRGGSSQISEIILGYLFLFFSNKAKTITTRFLRFINNTQIQAKEKHLLKHIYYDKNDDHLIMDATKKENANPVLFSIEKRTQRRIPLDWTKLGNFRQEESSSVVVPTNAEDKAIIRAIMDCSRSTTNGKGVSLLRKAGLVVPTYSRRKNTNNINKSNYPTITSSSWCSDSSRPVFSLAVDDTNEAEKGTVADETTNAAKRLKSENVVEEEKSEEDNNQTNNNVINNKNAGGNNESSIISAEEIFDIIRSIEDPEHPHSLEQLGVVSLEQVEISSTRANYNKQQKKNITNTYNHQDKITVRFTPTIPHCSMATLIGLCLRVKLFRSLPPTKFKVDVSIEPGTHVSEKAINKQLRDKERVRAALENKHLAGVVDKCIKNGMKATQTVD